MAPSLNKGCHFHWVTKASVLSCHQNPTKELVKTFIVAVPGDVCSKTFGNWNYKS